MACAHPMLNYNTFIPSFRFRNPLQYYIPCGRCLNCRVDKQNELTHRCEQELINFKSGAFVTCTYDDFHIVDKLRSDSSGKLVATLSKKDCVNFVKRLRQNINRNMPDTILSNHKFKYLVVGEYGGDGQIFDRPHLHFLFFGLDFAFCKRQFERSWQGQGIIKVLPILNGGIQYVLKYLDKQLFGDQAAIKYDNNNIERPFQNHSLGLGSSLYENQLDYIKSHNGCYRWKGKDVPVPMYYKNKYLISDNHFKNLNASVFEYKKFNNIKPKSLYDLHDYKLSKAAIRERNINSKLSLSGRPRYDFMSLNQLKNYSREYISELSKSAYSLQVPF